MMGMRARLTSDDHVASRTVMITAWAVPALLLTALGVSLNSRSETPRTDFADPLRASSVPPTDRAT